MTRTTLGRSRVRESRTLGSVEAKPNGLATRPDPMEMYPEQGAQAMRKTSIGLFVLALLVTTTSVYTRARLAQPIEELLLGRWTLVSWHVTDDSGHVSEPFGTEPEGVMDYLDSGRVGVHVRNLKAIPPDADISTSHPYVALARLASRSVSYNGTYEFDESTMNITHHVDESIDMSRLEQTYVWHIESIDHDSLTLTSNLGDEVAAHAEVAPGYRTG